MKSVQSLQSGEFFICDVESFNAKYKDKIHTLPYRIIVVADSKESLNSLEIPKTYEKRIATMDLTDINSENFKEKIIETWFNFVKEKYAPNTALYINFVGELKDQDLNESIVKEIRKDIEKRVSPNQEILDKFDETTKEPNSWKDILEDYLIKEKLIDNINELSQQQTMNDTLLLDSLYSHINATQFENINDNRNTFSYNCENCENIILLTRHAENKKKALEEVPESKGLNNCNISYFESLSAGSSQFLLYKELASEGDEIYAQMRIMEASMLKIGIFDERIIDNVVNKKAVTIAKEQNIFLISDINDFYALSSTKVHDDMLGVKVAGNSVEDNYKLDILIIHYGLIEKMKNDKKLSEDQFKTLLSSFAMVAITSGRGGITEYQHNNKIANYKFIGYSSLQEYFSQKTVNKIGLVNSLTSLIGETNV